MSARRLPRAFHKWTNRRKVKKAGVGLMFLRDIKYALICFGQAPMGPAQHSVKATVCERTGENAGGH